MLIKIFVCVLCIWKGSDISVYSGIKKDLYTLFRKLLPCPVRVEGKNNVTIAFRLYCLRHFLRYPSPCCGRDILRSLCYSVERIQIPLNCYKGSFSLRLSPYIPGSKAKGFFFDSSVKVCRVPVFLIPVFLCCFLGYIP